MTRLRSGPARARLLLPPLGAALALALAAALAVPAPALAMSCSAASELGPSDGPLVVGRVVSVDDRDFLLQVERVWGGPDVAPLLWIDQADPRRDLGGSYFEPHLGDRYAVAYDEATWSAGNCSVFSPDLPGPATGWRAPVEGAATGARSVSEDDARTVAETGVLPPGRHLGWRGAAAAGALALVGGAAVVLVVRRRRTRGRAGRR